MENAVCHFVFYSGPRKGEAQVFNTARIAIGRAGNCDFRLEAFQLEQVAAHHAEVLLEEKGAYVIYDLGTKSGTWINGERVQERASLLHEDYIRFGQDGPEIIFRIGQPLPGKQPLPKIFPVTADLEFFSGSDAGRIFPIDAGVISNIGRRSDLELPLDPRGDMIVSGNHCNIRYVNGHFVLTDTSRNGTYVNNELLEQPMEIIDADVIMLGDGGPQARFHVDEAKRHYPNHRPLSPVAPKTPEPRKAFERNENEQDIAGEPSAAEAAAAAAAAEMISAKPYSSGSPVTPGAESSGADTSSEELEAAPGGAAGSDEGTPDSSSELDESELDLLSATTADSALPPGGDATPVSDVPTASQGAVGRRRRFTLPATVPAVQNINFKSGKTIAVIAVGCVLVLAVLLLLFTNHGNDKAAEIERGDYEAALQKLKPMNNAAGGFTVQIPEGWTTRNSGRYISTESDDKNIAVDYVRDPKLNLAKMQELLARNGAKVTDTTEKSMDGKKVTMMHSSAGDLRRVAALHQPTSGPAALAMIETTEDALKKLDDDSLNKLLISDLQMAALPAPAAVASPRPAPTNALPRPQAPAPTAAPPTPQPTAASPNPTTAPTQASDNPTTSTGERIVSKSLGLAVTAPAGWTGASEESDEMIMLKDHKGLEIRIARDPGDLDAEATFKAMAEEKWNQEGRMNRKTYQAGEFSRDGQNLMLVLVPEKAGTTLVIYATSPNDFSREQRIDISQVIPQLVK